MSDGKIISEQKSRIAPWALWLLVLLAPLLVEAFWHGSPASAHAQSIDLSQSRKPAANGHVQFTAEPQTIVANKPATVLLHFHVDPGFHINSHTPRSEMLIPTRIALGEGEGVKVTAVDFPAGQPYSFSFEPKTRLDVYTNDVVLTAHVVAQPGQRALLGVLHYQACDTAACYPPKALPLEQPLTAK